MKLTFAQSSLSASLLQDKKMKNSASKPSKSSATSAVMGSGSVSSSASNLSPSAMMAMFTGRASRVSAPVLFGADSVELPSADVEVITPEMIPAVLDRMNSQSPSERLQAMQQIALQPEPVTDSRILRNIGRILYFNDIVGTNDANFELRKWALYAAGQHPSPWTLNGLLQQTQEVTGSVGFVRNLSAQVISRNMNAIPDFSKTWFGRWFKQQVFEKYDSTNYAYSRLDGTGPIVNQYGDKNNFYDVMTRLKLGITSEGYSTFLQNAVMVAALKDQGLAGITEVMEQFLGLVSIKENETGNTNTADKLNAKTFELYKAFLKNVPQNITLAGLNVFKNDDLLTVVETLDRYERILTDLDGTGWSAVDKASITKSYTQIVGDILNTATVETRNDMTRQWLADFIESDSTDSMLKLVLTAFDYSASTNSISTSMAWYNKNSVSKIEHQTKLKAFKTKVLEIASKDPGDQLYDLSPLKQFFKDLKTTEPSSLAGYYNFSPEGLRRENFWTQSLLQPLSLRKATILPQSKITPFWKAQIQRMPSDLNTVEPFTVIERADLRDYTRRTVAEIDEALPQLVEKIFYELPSTDSESGEPETKVLYPLVVDLVRLWVDSNNEDAFDVLYKYMDKDTLASTVLKELKERATNPKNPLKSSRIQNVNPKQFLKLLDKYLQGPDSNLTSFSPSIFKRLCELLVDKPEMTPEVLDLLLKNYDAIEQGVPLRKNIAQFVFLTLKPEMPLWVVEKYPETINTIFDEMPLVFIPSNIENKILPTELQPWGKYLTNNPLANTGPSSTFVTPGSLANLELKHKLDIEFFVDCASKLGNSTAMANLVPDLYSIFNRIRTESYRDEFWLISILRNPNFVKLALQGSDENGYQQLTEMLLAYNVFEAVPVMVQDSLKQYREGNVSKMLALQSAIISGIKFYALPELNAMLKSVTDPREQQFIQGIISQIKTPKKLGALMVSNSIPSDALLTDVIKNELMSDAVVKKLEAQQVSARVSQAGRASGMRLNIINNNDDAGGINIGNTNSVDGAVVTDTNIAASQASASRVRLRIIGDNEADSSLSIVQRMQSALIRFSDGDALAGEQLRFLSKQYAGMLVNSAADISAVSQDKDDLTTALQQEIVRLLDEIDANGLTTGTDTLQELQTLVDTIRSLAQDETKPMLSRLLTTAMRLDSEPLLASTVGIINGLLWSSDDQKPNAGTLYSVAVNPRYADIIRLQAVESLTKLDALDQLKSMFTNSDLTDTFWTAIISGLANIAYSENATTQQEVRSLFLEQLNVNARSTTVKRKALIEGLNYLQAEEGLDTELLATYKTLWAQSESRDTQVQPPESRLTLIDVLNAYDRLYEWDDDTTRFMRSLEERHPSTFVRERAGVILEDRGL